MIAVASQKLWRTFCSHRPPRPGRPPRLRNQRERVAKPTTLEPLIAGIFSTRSSAEWCQLFAGRHPLLPCPQPGRSGQRPPIHNPRNVPRMRSHAHHRHPRKTIRNPRRSKTPRPQTWRRHPRHARQTSKSRPDRARCSVQIRSDPVTTSRKVGTAYSVPRRSESPKKRHRIRRRADRAGCPHFSLSAHGNRCCYFSLIKR